MWQVLLCLWSGAAAGYLLRRRRWSFPARMIPWLVGVLLFFIGCEVGSDQSLLGSLGRIGGEALCVTLFTVAGCAVGARLFLKLVPGNLPMPPAPDEDGRHSALRRMAASLLVLFYFGARVLTGIAGWLSSFSPRWTFAALCLLLACVGFSVGQSDALLRNLKTLDGRLLLLPLVTFAGTWAGALAAAACLPRHTAAEWLAVSSGFGYYSLSAVLLTDLRSADLGTVALAHNVLREISVLLFAPFFARIFGPLAPVSIGGATTADTTLPAITAAAGAGIVPIAVFHGLTTDMAVPLLVPFFCAL